MTVDFAPLLQNRQSHVVIGRSRRFAALLAIIFPTVAVALVLGGLIKSKLDPQVLLTHPVFLILLVPGIASLIFWCKRYIKPALYALRRGDPIYLNGERLRVLGIEIEATPEMVLSGNRSALSLCSKNEEVLRIPAYFITIVHPEAQS